MKTACLFIVLLMLFGCSTVEPFLPKGEIQSIPMINHVSKINIGEPLLSQGELIEIPVIILPKGIYQGKLPSGIYRKVFLLDGYEVFSLNNIKKVPSVATVDGDEMFLIAYGSNELRFGTIINNVFNSLGKIENDQYKRDRIQEYIYNKLQQILIYTGISGNILHVTYCESYDNIARPAFTVNAVYDLNISKIISYRKAKIEVKEANNQYIEYSIIEAF